MPIEEESVIKANIWRLDTVEIRWVLRWLNNHVRKTVDATVLAKARHEWCHQNIIAKYSPDNMEMALNALATIKGNKPEPTPNVIVESPGDSYQQTVIVDEATDWAQTDERLPDDPITKAIAKPLLAAADRNVTRRLDAYYQKEIQPRLEHFDKDVSHRVGQVMREFGENVEKRLVMVEDALMASQKTELTIVFPDADKKELGLVHKQQTLLIKYLMAGCHVFLTGPAGSGKSTAGQKAADALGIKFGEASCCSQDTATKFLGYMDAVGVYHTTEFREAYAKGGLFVLDEIDAGNPNVLAVLNSALSGYKCAFPDGMVEKHPKFRCVATGNTWGTGKTVQYVGRNAIDAATLNRFVVMYWDYDEALETAVAGMPSWSKYVQECREETKRRGINYLITPRASILGAAALKTGIPLKDVIDNVLFPNLDPEVRRHMPAPPTITEIR
jgi:cobaltochelatase CobS